MSALSEQISADVVAAADGDRDAFARIVDATKRTVASIAVAIVGDVQASQDVAQEVFLAAWRGRGRLRNPMSFLPWLRQITRNRARTWLRDEARRRMSAQTEDLVSAAVDPRPTPAEQTERQDELSLVTAAIAELPDETREVVILYYREDRSVAQVAELLEMRPDAVKQRLSRARRRLREDVATRLEATLRRTAPGAAFTGAVLASLASAASPVAAGVAIGAVGKSGAATPWAKLGFLLSGVGLGAAGGIGGVVFGLRRHFREATSAEERRALGAFRATGIAAVLLTCAGLAVSGQLESAALAIAVYAGFGAVLWAMYFVWLPSIVGPRLAAERRADPAAAARQRRDRTLSWIGYLVGVLGGGAGLLAGLWRGGLL